MSYFKKSLAENNEKYRQARIPLKFHEEVIYNNLGFKKGDELLEVLGCRQKCKDAEVGEQFFLPRAPGFDNITDLVEQIEQLIEDFLENRPWEARCDCSAEMERWLTSWAGLLTTINTTIRYRGLQYMILFELLITHKSPLQAIFAMRWTT